MKKTVTILLPLLAMISLGMVIGDTPSIESFGAPPSSTGAPGEKTCLQSGCHDDGPTVYSKGSIEISIDGNPTVIKAGEYYTIHIRVMDDQINRFGFQFTALDSLGNQYGQFIINDSAHTQILMNHNEFTDREYVTYTNLGTFPAHPGKHEWTFTWRAPQTMQGTVQFYSAAVSANADNTDKGDFVYTSTKTLPMVQTTNIADQAVNAHAYYDQLNRILSCEVHDAIINQAMLYNSNGDLLFNHIINDKRFVIEYASFASGMYFLKYSINSTYNIIPVIIY